MAARKPVLSPTRIATFLECRRLYHYVYIQKLPRYFQPRPWFSLGVSLHRALEEHYRAGGPQREDAGALLARLEQSWVGAGYQDAEAEAARRAEAGQWLRTFHEQGAVVQAETLLVESPLRADRGPYVLWGRIDRLDRLPNGELEVVDYKSGSRVLTEADAAGDLALAIYQLLTFLRFPCPRVKGSLYHLGTNQKVSVIREAAQLEDVGRRVDGVFALIQAEQDFERVRSASCDRCDFYARCWGRRQLA